jgi:hypothetical protein
LAVEQLGLLPFRRSRIGEHRPGGLTSECRETPKAPPFQKSKGWATQTFFAASRCATRQGNVLRENGPNRTLRLWCSTGRESAD